MLFLRVSVLACLVVLTSCASKKSKNLKPLPLPKIEQSAKVKKQWSVKIGKGQDRRYVKLSPAVNGSVVYASDTRGNVKAIDSETGKTTWKVSLKTAISGAVGAGFDLVLLGTYDGEVIALDASNGQEKWRAQASSEILAAPQTNGSIVAVTTIDAKLFAFDAQTGELQWSHDHVSPSLTLRGTASPVLTPSQVIAAFDNGQLLSFSPSDGSVGWEVRIAQPKGKHDLQKMVDIDGQPVLNSAYIYTSAFQGSTMAIARGAGRVIWKSDVAGFTAPAVDYSQVYVVTDQGRVAALSRTDGSIKWENEQLLRRQLGAPAVMGDALISIDKKGFMHVFNKESGDFIARIKPAGKGFKAAPVTHNDGVLLLSNNGVLSYYTLAE